MLNLRRFTAFLMFFLAGSLTAQTQSPAEPDPNTTAAAAAVASGAVEEPHTPEFIEHAVDLLLEQFDVTSSENTPARYIACAAIVIITILLRRVVTTILFGFFRRLSSRTQTTFDDKFLEVIEPPVGMLVIVLGLVGALKALKLSPAADNMLGYAYTIAFSLCIFWLLLRAFIGVLDHLEASARQKKLGVAAFMPWIKKTLIAVFVVFGVLMIAQSLGANVQAFLAGLGIGGLAFALAAQDTIANIFGSVVVAVDQPFKIGEAVKIGAHDGVVEDIGLRSTKLRTPAKNLVVIPNKLVAAEPIVNNSRFTHRRVEQVISLTYDTSAEKMEAMVEAIREIILREEDVRPASVMVFFRDLNASSLDIWMVYETKDADFQKQMRLRQRINLAIMRAVEERDLQFAYPTQTVHLAGSIAERLVAPDRDNDGERPQA